MVPVDLGGKKSAFNVLTIFVLVTETPLPFLQLVHCLSCHGTFVAGGMSKVASTPKRMAVEMDPLQSLSRETTTVAAKTLTPLKIFTPKQYGSTPSNKQLQCSSSTPSNKRRHQRRSTLKAQLAKTSAAQHQRQLGEGASSKLTAFLTSIQ